MRTTLDLAPMSDADWESRMGELAGPNPTAEDMGAAGSVLFVERVVKPLVARIEALERHIRETATMKYRGVWRDTDGYLPGDCVTHAGSLWVCNAINNARPGTAKTWTLAVKKGSAG